VPSPPKRILFEHFARLGKALSSGPRLELLDFLAQGPRSVEDLAKLAGLSVANTSRHLLILRASGLLVSNRRGLQIFYSLSGDDVLALLRTLRATAETHLAEVSRLADTYRQQRDTLETLSLPDLRRRLREGSVVLLDVRPGEEFAAGHIPGAINIPLAQLRSRLDSLPPDIEVVAYCRGPYCFLSDDAVALLHSSGRSALRLAEGFPDWKARGWRTEALSA